MLFNVMKCKVLHIGHNNAYCDYSMNGEILQSVTEETDLGIIASNDLKPFNPLNVLAQLKCMFLTFNILIESKINISLCTDLIFTYHLFGF